VSWSVKLSVSVIPSSSFFCKNYNHERALKISLVTVIISISPKTHRTSSDLLAVMGKEREGKGKGAEGNGREDERGGSGGTCLEFSLEQAPLFCTVFS